LYFQAVLARYDVDVATENRRTFEQLTQFNLARFQEGAIAEADLIKVRLERIKFDSAIRQAQLNYRQTAIRLLERVGEISFTPAEISGTLDVKLVKPDLESLRQTAVHERADVLAAEKEVGAARARITLEQARGKTDLIPYAGYKRLATDNTLMLGVTVPLKTRDRNEAGIARAQADLKIAETQVQLVRNRVLADVEAAYEAFQSAIAQAQTFCNEILNQADESQSIALAAYQEGGTALLPVLEAERTRAEVRQQYFRTLFDYQNSLIDLELAVGKEIQP
jgi:cobalt-zinc-cadmium efflux system outer membrane protein